MFVWPRIGRDDEKRIYVMAMNADTYKFSVGHAAHWYYYMSGTVNTATEYAVTHAATTTDGQASPALFAGVVADEAIPSGQYGKIQIYGYHSAVVVSGVNGAAPFTDVFTEATHAYSVFSSYVLKPVAAFGNSTGANASIGAMAPIALSTTVAGTETYASADINQQLCGIWPGGYALPLANPSATIATNASGTVKAFIQCL